MLSDAGSSLDRQLNGTGTPGIVGIKLGGNRVVELNSPAGPLNERGSMPTLSALPASTVEHGGNFQLVGMNFWRSGDYLVNLEHGIAPHPNTPNAPFVEAPCVVFEDIVPGYGPNFDGVWGRLSIVEEEVRAAIVAAYNIAAGCIAAIEGFAGSIVDAVRLLDEFLANPDAFINTQVEEIRAAVEAAVDDPDAAVGDFVKAALQLDLLRENPAKWVGSVGCEIILEVLLSMTGAGAAALAARITEEVLDFINARRRAVGDGDVDAFDPDVSPRDAAEQANFDGDTRDIVVCGNSFAGGTLVQLADGSYSPIEDLGVGDSVLSYNLSDGSFEPAMITVHWSDHEPGLVDVVVDGTAIRSTPAHRFLNGTDLSVGWVEAQNLQVGDELVASRGDGVVDSVVVASTAETLVWDMTVVPNHNFVVGGADSSVVVHNEDCVKLEPNTPEHKAKRWEEYQERYRGREDEMWSESHWSKVYDANMVRATRAREAADAAAAVARVGDPRRAVDTPDEFPADGLLPAGRFDSGRRWDYADSEERVGFEHKSGEVVYATNEVLEQAVKDGAIVSGDNDWTVTWTFDGRPSRPLWDTLDNLGISIESADSPGVPMPRPGA